MYHHSIDRKVYDVKQDIMVNSGSASEVIGKLPLVQVDLDWNFSFRNSSAMILINGKVSPLMGKNAAMLNIEYGEIVIVLNGKFLQLSTTEKNSPKNPKLFYCFSKSTDSEGMSLGLAIAKQI